MIFFWSCMILACTSSWRVCACCKRRETIRQTQIKRSDAVRHLQSAQVPSEKQNFFNSNEHFETISAKMESDNDMIGREGFLSESSFEDWERVEQSIESKIERDLIDLDREDIRVFDKPDDKKQPR